MAARDPSTPVSCTLEQLLAESRWLTSLARALLGDEHEAEDVAQETRLAAVERGTFDVYDVVATKSGSASPSPTACG